MLTVSNQNGRRLLFVAANRMTEETAYGLLHIMSHLSETAFGLIIDHTGPDQSTPNTRMYALNQSVFELLPAVVTAGRLSQHRLMSTCLTFPPTITLQQLEECSRRIQFKRAYIRTDHAGRDNSQGLVEGTLQLVAGAGEVCSELSVAMQREWIPGAVDSIIEVRGGVLWPTD